jgi:hypothetical protein
MNSVVRELADRTWRRTHASASDEFCSQFAQYIISECVSTIEQRLNNNDARGLFNSGETMQMINLAVNQHFGEE